MQQQILECKTRGDKSLYATHCSVVTRLVYYDSIRMALPDSFFFFGWGGVRYVSHFKPLYTKTSSLFGCCE